MLLWCDGFDHYGVLSNLTEGPWAEIGTSVTLVTTNTRTGTHSLRFAQSSATATLARRVLGGAKTTVGIAAAFYYMNLPTNPVRDKIFDFRDANNVAQVSIGLDTTGTISAYRGTLTGTLLGTSASPVITAETQQHIEAVVFFSQTVGTIEVRVNGVTVLSLSGLDTVQSSLVECSQVSVCGSGNAASTSTVVAHVDDLFCYDDTGSFNNAFIGDRRVLTLFPDADTIQADWTPVGSGTGFGAIDEANPDGDTTYISAGIPGSPTPTSEFGMENLPAGVSAISAVVLVNMSRKTEAGIANVQMSVISGASETAGTDQPMTEIYTYRHDVFEIDPDSAAPFTPSEVDALLIKADRTA
jgi:hypothetical protein